jgi:hypothetical protein
MDKAQSFADWRAARDAIERELETIAVRWKAIPGNGAGPMGLTPDSVKAGPAWQSCNREHARAFAELRRLNAYGVKRFARELALERRAAREAAAMA